MYLFTQNIYNIKNVLLCHKWTALNKKKFEIHQHFIVDYYLLLEQMFIIKDIF